MSRKSIYRQAIKVEKMVDGLPVSLILQERTSERHGQTWWTFSWRTRLSPHGPNRRFYFNDGEYWKIPTSAALTLMREMDKKGGFHEKYFDQRKGRNLPATLSWKLTPKQRSTTLSGITDPNEYWGADPAFVIAYDQSDMWKKVMIVNAEDCVATFRSITEDAEYKPKKEVRPNEGWWLDNAMMDAGGQLMREFYTHLQHLAGIRPN